VEASLLVDHRDNLLSYALMLTGRRDQAEDLVQETFVKALQKIDGLRSPHSTRAWLSTILRNTWLNELRRRKTAHIEPDFDLSSVPDTKGEKMNNPLSHYERTVELNLVRTTLQKLPIKSREILIMREYDDLSYRVIANILDCPVGTVMSRLARARLKLRDSFSVTQQRSVKRTVA
jgi:RNA polymerase sigma-70 factor, ECF subfamily